MITREQVAEQLRRAIRSEIEIRRADPSRDPLPWSEESGDVPYMVGDWKIVFFNDCGDLDYTDSAQSPNDQGCFDDWYPDQFIDPVDLLSKEESTRLLELLEAAK